jgi:hypothetical protein
MTTAAETVEAAFNADPFNQAAPRPRFFPDELRTHVQPSIHEAEPVWARSVPANPANDLREIASKVLTKADREQIQQYEDEIGCVAADRKKHCDPNTFAQAEWDLSQDINILAEDFAKRSRSIQEEKDAIRAWTLALDRREAEHKEKLHPYALRIAVELPGKVAKSINELLEVAGPDGVMAHYGLAQNGDAVVIINPLRRLHSLAVSWIESLKANDAEAKESRIRAILFDAGVLNPKVAVYRKQF